jgi:lysophospholipase L1-like esterase
VARPPLRVVGLGDSVPAADTCDCDGFLEQLVPDLHATTGRSVTLRNDATSGWTTRDVLTDLSRGRARVDLTQGADLVVVEIGANDFDLARLTDASCAPAGSSPCFRDTLTRLRSDLTTIVDRVRALAPGTRVALMGYWNVSVDGSVGRALGPTYVAGSDALTRDVNQVVLDVARDTGATYVDAYTPLKGTEGDRNPTEDLLDDGDHPDASGHARLADAVLDALQASGAVATWAA